MTFSRVRVVLLAMLPSLGAMLGAWADEARALGFTTWRSACRASGLSPGSVLAFTWQLLPGAITGALVGGLAIQAFAITQRTRAVAPRDCAAAHLGCTLAMPLGLAVCTLALPVGVMLVADVTLAVAFGLLAQRVMRGAVPSHP